MKMEEYGDSAFPQNVGTHLPNCTLSRPIKPQHQNLNLLGRKRRQSRENEGKDMKKKEKEKKKKRKKKRKRKRKKKKTKAFNMSQTKGMTKTTSALRVP